MTKYKIVALLLLVTLAATPAFAQVDNRKVKTIAGTVTGIDPVGNVISIQNEDQNQMSFSVPDKTPIAGDAKDIGLMDIKEGNPVTIQYFSPSPAKFVAVSIVDNKKGSY